LVHIEAARTTFVTVHQRRVEIREKRWHTMLRYARCEDGVIS
jgi:hypothetical protein